MRKDANKLQLYRDTVYRLDPEAVLSGDLKRARGGDGIVSSDNQDCTYSRRCITR